MPSKPSEKWLEKIRALRHRRLAARRLRQIARWFSAQNEMEGPVLYDVGARSGPSEPYGCLSGIRGFRSVGFEPDFVEAERLRAAKAFDYICSVALGAREEKRTLYIAKDPGSSSIFPPNDVEIARHTTWNLFETTKTIEIPVEPLDQVIAKQKLPMPDYLKIDCEGAEDEILQGSANALKNLCGLTFEARFRDFYRGGATFSQLTDRMFSAGFICLRLDPVGSFFGSMMMFDVVMVRHPEGIKNRRQFLLCVLFCLLHGNWLYAKRIVDLRANEFESGDLRKFFRSNYFSPEIGL